MNPEKMFVTDNPFCQIENNFLNDDLSSWDGSGPSTGASQSILNAFYLKLRIRNL